MVGFGAATLERVNREFATANFVAAEFWKAEMGTT
jgi:hypothetical protein